MGCDIDTTESRRKWGCGCNGPLFWIVYVLGSAASIYRVTPKMFLISQATTTQLVDKDNGGGVMEKQIEPILQSRRSGIENFYGSMATMEQKTTMNRLFCPIARSSTRTSRLMEHP